MGPKSTQGTKGITTYKERNRSLISLGKTGPPALEWKQGMAQRRRNLPDPSFHESRWGEGLRTSLDRAVPRSPSTCAHTPQRKHMPTLNQHLPSCTPSDLLPSVYSSSSPSPCQDTALALVSLNPDIGLPFPTMCQMQSSHFDFTCLENS